jgi:hypothetical protein
MAYGTAALIRSVEEAFSSATDYLDATLVAWCTNFADPEIDARLKSGGFTTPVPATVPVLITTISAMLGAAHGLDSFIGQFTGSEVERAKALRERARELIQQIVSGELDVGLTQSDSGAPIQYDDDPETYPETAGVVGGEENWEMPTEDRE